MMQITRTSSFGLNGSSTGARAVSVPAAGLKESCDLSFGTYPDHEIIKMAYLKTSRAQGEWSPLSTSMSS